MKYVAFVRYVSKKVFLLGMLVMIFISLSQQTLTAQDTIPPHSAKKATIYSLALPGLGQAYNKKYWKIPVIYAGFGVLAYNIRINNVETRKFTEAYRYRINGDTFAINNEYVARYPNVNDLLRGRDFYRRRVELSIIFSAAWYLLNVVDAAVDAHFFDYDISEDLSLYIQPIIIQTPEKPLGTGGIQLSINFK